MTPSTLPRNLYGRSHSLHHQSTMPLEIGVESFTAADVAFSISDRGIPINTWVTSRSMVVIRDTFKAICQSVSAFTVEFSFAYLVPD